eukprot:scaffold1064_cov85-Amphora_coffeaeformis.AAC.4
MPSFHFWKRMLSLWTAATCIKILLQPSYHSTDLLVHRHWKAVTLDAAATDWYADDEMVNNRHTLDYPPAFAWFEAGWSNVMTPQRVQWFLGRMEHWAMAVPTTAATTTANENNDNKDEDDWTRHCLQLLPSDDHHHADENDANDDSTFLWNDVAMMERYPACKVYLRWTVILSDVVFWWGAWKLAVTTTTAPVMMMVMMGMVRRMRIKHQNDNNKGKSLGHPRATGLVDTGRAIAKNSGTLDVHHTCRLCDDLSRPRKGHCDFTGAFDSRILASRTAFGLADPCGGFDEFTSSALSSHRNIRKAGQHGPVFGCLAFCAGRVGCRRKQSALGCIVDTPHDAGCSCDCHCAGGDSLVLVGSFFFCSIGLDELGIGHGLIRTGMDATVVPIMARHHGLSEDFGG